MYKMCAVLHVLSLSLFSFGCGDSEIDNNPNPEDLANSQCTVQESPDGEQSVIRCSDGSMAVIKNGQPGLKGEDGVAGEQGERGEDGKSADVRENDLPVGDPNCPNGGKIIEFYVEDEPTPRAVNYQCTSQSEAGCDAGTQLDPVLGACISMVDVRFEGVVVDASNVSDFPADVQPSSVVTSQDNAAQATPCSGVIRAPQGLSPINSYGGSFGFYESEFVFGHVKAYGIEVTVDDVTFERDRRLNTPDSANHKRTFSSISQGGELRVTSTVAPLKGFDLDGESKVVLTGLRTLSENDDFSLALPTEAASWSLLSMPIVSIEFADASFISTGSITCQIMQFVDP